MSLPASEHVRLFSGMDIMFAQMMIPSSPAGHRHVPHLHNQGLESGGEGASLEELALRQGPEIEQMRSWFKAANEPTEMGHQMSMDGMLSDAEMERLSSASGAEFDELFLLGMIAHHEGAIEMAQMVVDSKNLEARELGAAVIQVQTLEIAELQVLQTN